MLNARCAAPQATGHSVRVLCRSGDPGSWSVAIWTGTRYKARRKTRPPQDSPAGGPRRRAGTARSRCIAALKQLHYRAQQLLGRRRAVRSGRRVQHRPSERGSDAAAAVGFPDAAAAVGEPHGASPLGRHVARTQPGPTEHDAVRPKRERRPPVASSSRVMWVSLKCPEMSPGNVCASLAPRPSLAPVSRKCLCISGSTTPSEPPHAPRAPLRPHPAPHCAAANRQATPPAAGGEPCRRAAPGKATHRWRGRSHSPRGPKTLRSLIPWAPGGGENRGAAQAPPRGPRGRSARLDSAAAPQRRALPTEEL